jgi:hypothetical protein
MSLSPSSLPLGVLAAMHRKSAANDARIHREPPPDDAQGVGEPVECEQDLHEQIRKECAGRGWLAFHGSMAHRTFRTEGEPDWVILAGQGRTILCECKTAKGKLSTEQVGIALWASKLGHTVHVVRSFEQFLEIVNQQH